MGSTIGIVIGRLLIVFTAVYERRETQLAHASRRIVAGVLMQRLIRCRLLFLFFGNARLDRKHDIDASN